MKARLLVAATALAVVSACNSPVEYIPPKITALKAFYCAVPGQAPLRAFKRLQGARSKSTDNFGRISVNRLTHPKNLTYVRQRPRGVQAGGRLRRHQLPSMNTSSRRLTTGSVSY